MHVKFACAFIVCAVFLVGLPVCYGQDDPSYDELFLSDDTPEPTVRPTPTPTPTGTPTVTRAPTPTPTPTPTLSPIEVKKKKLEGEIIPKLFDKYPVLTREEFILYLEVVEATNPLKTWQQIATKLHQRAYPEDANRSVAGIDLFKSGPENDGWEKVQLPGEYVPKFVIGENGKRIDIAHAYAGLRAGLNRGSTKTWWMTRVNTDWGDSYQVAGERLGATGTIIGGIFTFDGDQISEGADKWSNAENYKTEPQIRGNRAAIKAQTFLTEGKGKKLSEAFKGVLWPQTLKRSKPSFGELMLRSMTYSPYPGMYPYYMPRR